MPGREDVFAHWFAELGAAAGAIPGYRFDVPGVPPRWKMAITTFAGVYPVAYLVLRFIGPHETTWPASLRALLTAGILVPSLTWIVMPRLTKLLRRWLRP